MISAATRTLTSKRPGSGEYDGYGGLQSTSVSHAVGWVDAGGRVVSALLLAGLLAAHAVAAPRVADVPCGEAERAGAKVADDASLMAEQLRDRARGAAEWSTIRPAAEACAVGEGNRVACAREVARFIRRAGRVRVENVRGAERAEAACDPAIARERASSYEVSLPEVGYAAFLLAQIQAQAAPVTGTTAEGVVALRAAYLTERDAAMRVMRLESIERLRDIMNNSHGGAFDMLLRLAELYADEGRWLALEAERVCRGTPGCERPADAEAVAYFEKALKLLTQLSDARLVGAWRDRATAQYRLGLNLEALDRTDAAKATLADLVAGNPRSDHARAAALFVVEQDMPPDVFLPRDVTRETEALAYALYRRGLARMVVGDRARGSVLLAAAARLAHDGECYALELAVQDALARLGR